LAVETAATQTKPAYAGSKEFDFSSVHAGELGFYSSEFYSPELKLTPMIITVLLGNTCIQTE
jgi:hypothetical protein